MARRRHRPEEHINHEAWAIPYGDLITLLLAFFVVMYALSSVNEGKYRVLSDSLQSAFRGTPDQTDSPETGPSVIQLKKTASPSSALPPAANAQASTVKPADKSAGEPQPPEVKTQTPTDADDGSLARVANDVESTMADLIAKNMVAVRRRGQWVEVEVRTDILFTSGVANLQPFAQDILGRLADTLKPFPNAIRVEGHTDNKPINTATFPSNWELSAARAASVVHLFSKRGIDPARLMVVGFGEERPAQSNASAEGRNANRRVLMLVMGNSRKSDKTAEEPDTAPNALAAPDTSPRTDAPAESARRS